MTTAGALAHHGDREMATASAPVTIRRTTARGADVEQYVAAHPDATAYHHPGWLHVIATAFGHRHTCLVAERAGRIQGVLPLVFFSNRVFGRFVVSMPFLNYGGVLADHADAEVALLDAAIEETRAAGADYLELRHARQQFPALTPKRHKVAMRLRLEATADAQWTALDRKVRNLVRKAEKASLTVASGGAELVTPFYQVFARNMRDLGTPVYGRGFFDAVLAQFPATSRVFVISQGDTPVAASIVHWHRHVMEVPWASALEESNAVSANMLLYWQMLRAAIEGGMQVFDFGRSTPNEGTFRFKKQWGAEPHELVWEYWTAPGRPMPNLSPSNTKFSLAIAAWQRLPLSVATALGPSIVRHIP